MTPINTPITPEELSRLHFQRLQIEKRRVSSRAELKKKAADLAAVDDLQARSCFTFDAAKRTWIPHDQAICVVRIRDNDEGLTLICPWGEAGAHLVIDHTYTITVGHMSQAAFDALPEFEC